MEKHLDLLKQVFKGYFYNDTWITLPSSTQNFLFKTHIYDYFKL